MISYSIIHSSLRFLESPGKNKGTGDVLSGTRCVLLFQNRIGSLLCVYILLWSIKCRKIDLRTQKELMIFMGLCTRKWQDKSLLSYPTHRDTHGGVFTLVWGIFGKVLHSTVYFWQFHVLSIICINDEQNARRLSLTFIWKKYNTLLQWKQAPHNGHLGDRKKSPL